MPLAYIFQSDKPEALKNDGGEALPADEVLQLRGLNSVNFEQLYLTCTKGTKAKFELVAHDDDYEQVTEQFPVAFVDWIAAAPDDALTSGVAEFASSDENRWGPTSEEWLSILRDVKRLAVTSQTLGHHLYLWNCV